MVMAGKDKAVEPEKMNRRTQAERSDATQRRLIEATLRCLQKYGYADCSVSQIVAEAKVSRGALVHHYRSKNELIVDAARSLMVEVYDRLDAFVVDANDHDRRLGDLVERIWSEFFASPVHSIYLELLVASRRDEELVKLLRALGPSLESRMTAIFNRYFESDAESVGSIMDMFMLTRWFLRGMAIDADAFGGTDRIKDFLRLWTSLLATQLNVRTDSGSPQPQTKE
jgi:AcrR family transcriptional regulator